jgi:hypothetical protein
LDCHFILWYLFILRHLRPGERFKRELHHSGCVGLGGYRVDRQQD